jgi:transcriptional regulator with XRE-family HTH domain
VIVPSRLRDLREKRGLTRGEVAIALDTPEATIYRWEMAEYAICDERKARLAKLLKVTPSGLRGRD